MFQNTSATKKIFQLKKRIRAVAGGMSASKTISILVWLIDYAQTNNNKTITVVAESVPHLRLGALRDFKAIMREHGYWDNNNWNKSSSTYHFRNTIIEFISFDKFGKAHGPRRDILFINEANNIPYNIADQLIGRTREIVWLDWNPSSEFWFYTEMQPNRDDIDFITLTYKDNEALDETSKQEILSHKHNKQWWTVYGLGQLGELENRIYRDWKIIPERPHEAKLVSRGLDFGYSVDPTAIVDIYKYNGGFILEERLHKKGMSNRQIADVISTLEDTTTIADSAEPKSIDEIYEYGINIIPAIKGQGSVAQGISFIQDQKISVTQRSVNLIKAYRNYNWLLDKDGKQTGKPDHYLSDQMDAVRYGLNYLIPKKDKIIKMPQEQLDW